MKKMLLIASALALLTSAAHSFETATFVAVGPKTCNNLVFQSSPTVQDCTMVVARISDGCRYIATLDGNKVQSRVQVYDDVNFPVCTPLSAQQQLQKLIGIK